MGRFFKWLIGQDVASLFSKNKGMILRLVAFYSILSIVFVLVNVYLPALIFLSATILVLKALFVPYLIIKLAKNEDWVKRSVFKRFFKFCSRIFNRAGLFTAMILGFMMVIASKLFDMANPNLLSENPSVNWFIFIPTSIMILVFGYFAIAGAFVGFIRGMTGNYTVRANMIHSLYVAKNNWVSILATAFVYYGLVISIKALSAFVISLMVTGGYHSVPVVISIYSVGFVIDWFITVWGSLKIYSLVRSDKDSVDLKM